MISAYWFSLHFFNGHLEIDDEAQVKRALRKKISFALRIIVVVSVIPHIFHVEDITAGSECHG